MRVTAKADYAVRAAIELAAANPEVVKGEHVARTQEIPLNFLENILGDLKHAGLVVSKRGPEGGYRLALAPAEITVADVMRAVEGPLATVRGERPESLEYAGSAEPLQRVWIALRANLRGVLEEVSLEDVVRGTLPRSVADLANGRSISALTTPLPRKSSRTRTQAISVPNTALMATTTAEATTVSASAATACRLDTAA